MPGLVVFGRRWGIASDDLVFPGCFELFVRVLWYVFTLLSGSYSLWTQPVITLIDSALFTVHTVMFSAGGLAP